MKSYFDLIIITASSGDTSSLLFIIKGRQRRDRCIGDWLDGSKKGHPESVKLYEQAL